MNDRSSSGFFLIYPSLLCILDFMSFSGHLCKDSWCNHVVSRCLRAESGILLQWVISLSGLDYSDLLGMGVDFLHAILSVLISSA